MFSLRGLKDRRKRCRSFRCHEMGNFYHLLLSVISSCEMLLADKLARLAPFLYNSRANKQIQYIDKTWKYRNGKLVLKAKWLYLGLIFGTQTSRHGNSLQSGCKTPTAQQNGVTRLHIVLQDNTGMKLLGLRLWVTKYVATT